MSLYEGPSVERVLGYKPEELIGRSVLELIHPDDLLQAAEKFDECLSAPGWTVRAKVRRLHRDGTWRWVEGVAKNLLDDASVRGIVINSRDVTEREILAEQLERTSRISSLGRLAATVAHEYNNILMAIQPYTEIVRMRVADAVTQNAALRIAEAVGRGRRLSDDLLRFTHAAEPALEALELGPWLSDLVAELTPSLGPGIHVTVSVEPETSIRADSMQIRQVFTNLMFNARDAMSGTGRISITARREHSYQGIVQKTDRFVCVSVRDSGPGMPEYVRHHIFEPFFTTKRKGTGLGLAVTHQIVKQHGGEIFVESEAGSGTVFHLLFESAEHEAAVAGAHLATSS